MKAQVIRIENSRGVRPPKTIPKIGKRLVLKPTQNPRRGWDKAFACMRKRGDDRLLDIAAIGAASQWDEREWTYPA